MWLVTARGWKLLSQDANPVGLGLSQHIFLGGGVRGVWLWGFPSEENGIWLSVVEVVDRQCA